MRSTLLLRGLLLSLAIGAAGASAAAQDDPDIDVWYGSTTNAGHPGRMLDMSYTGEGALIAAYVEYVPGAGDDRIVVLRREPTGGAFQVLSNHAYGFEHVLELSLTVPRQHSGDKSRDRVYLAVHFATDVGLGIDHEWAALVSGPYDQPWKYPGRMAVADDIGQPSSSWRPWNPSVAAVPAKPQDFGSHHAVLAFAFPQAAGTAVMRATSSDLGRNLAPTVVAAGPQSQGATGSGQIDLSQGSYGNPSVASDDRNAYLVLAFQDDDRGMVHVVGAQPPQANAFYVHGTVQGDMRRELAPRVASDDGHVAVTYLTDPVQAFGGRPLLWSSGVTWDASSWAERGSLHGRAVTPGDVDLREGLMYVAARCFEDQGTKIAPLIAFSAPRDGGGSSAVRVSDHVTFTVQPRVALTPDGLSPARVSHGYTTCDWTPSWAPDGGFVNLDL